MKDLRQCVRQVGGGMDDDAHGRGEIRWECFDNGLQRPHRTRRAADDYEIVPWHLASPENEGDRSSIVRARREDRVRSSPLVADFDPFMGF